jgi:hypothetical protein
MVQDGNERSQKLVFLELSVVTVKHGPNPAQRAQAPFRPKILPHVVIRIRDAYCVLVNIRKASMVKMVLQEALDCENHRRFASLY